MAVQITELCGKLNIALEPFWVSRDSAQIGFCDELRKRIDTSDYWLSDKYFPWLERRRGPFSDDYFTTDRSWRLRPFYAKFRCDQSRSGKMIQVERFRLWMVCPWEILSPTFRGRTKFNMIAVKFNFRK